MEAVVLGGGGLTGRCAVRDLARGRHFERIRVADLDLPLAEAAARNASGTPAEAQKVDVRDPSALHRAIEGAAVCVNAVQYTFNLHVMKACLEARVPYLDFGGLFHMTRKQLEWHERFRSAGLLAIPGLGEVPGVSNILAMEATRDLPRVDSIIIRCGWRDLTENSPDVLFTWSPSTFLDEMQMNAVVWEGGAYREYPPLSGAELFEFPPPVGPTKVFRTLHSEAATLPESLRDKGLTHCEWKEGGPGIDLLRTMAQLGLGSERAVEVKGTPVVPREFLLALLKREKLLGIPEGLKINDWEIVDLEIRGVGPHGPEVRHATARFPPKPEWGLSVTEYAVGICGAIGAEMIAGGKTLGTGVLPPELCIPGPLFRAALKERGAETSIQPAEPPLPGFPT